MLNIYRMFYKTGILFRQIITNSIKPIIDVKSSPFLCLFRQTASQREQELRTPAQHSAYWRAGVRIKQIPIDNARVVNLNVKLLGMKVFKFSKINQVKKNVFISILLVVIFLLAFILLDNYIRRSYVFLILTLSLSAVLKIRKASVELEEIIVDDDIIKLYFFNKMKKPVRIQKVDVNITYKDSELIFRKLGSLEFIGKAYKDVIEEVDQWDDLKIALKKDIL